MSAAQGVRRRRVVNDGDVFISRLEFHRRRHGRGRNGESENKSETERVIESSVGRQRRGEAGRDVREVAAAGLSGRSLAGPVVPLSSLLSPMTS